MNDSIILKVWKVSIKPTLPVVGILISLAFLTVFAVGLHFTDKLQFNPAILITEVIRTTLGITLIFWLVEYQKEQTETGRVNFSRKVYVESQLIKKLQTIKNAYETFHTEIENPRDVEGDSGVRKNFYKIKIIQSEWERFQQNLQSTTLAEYSLKCNIDFSISADKVNMENLDDRIKECPIDEHSANIRFNISELNYIIDHLSRLNT